eukprot:scaffold37598_cov66-Phaeocystis_antarctica.AAC.2
MPEAGTRTAYVLWCASCPVPQARTLRRRPERVARTYSTEAPGRTCQHSSLLKRSDWRKVGPPPPPRKSDASSCLATSDASSRLGETSARVRASERLSACSCLWYLGDTAASDRLGGTSLLYSRMRLPPVSDCASARSVGSAGARRALLADRQTDRQTIRWVTKRARCDLGNVVDTCAMKLFFSGAHALVKRKDLNTTERRWACSIPLLPDRVRSIEHRLLPLLLLLLMLLGVSRSPRGPDVISGRDLICGPDVIKAPD